MTMKNLVAGLAAIGFLAFAGTLAWADSDYEYGKQMPALIKAMPGAKVPLDQGIKTAEAGGKAISAQYEVDEDAGFQLSVFVAGGDGSLSEVIVNYSTGTIKSSATLTDPDDIKDAKKQLAALAKAGTPLSQAVAEATKANPGYVAIRVVPKLSGDESTAQITLLKGGETKKVSQKL